MKRADDFETRRAHLETLSDAELEARFWNLIDEMIVTAQQRRALRSGGRA